MNQAERATIVGYVHNGMVHARFMRALMNALGYDTRHDQIVRNLYEAESTDIVQNRNIIVQGFLKDPENQWLWFVDTDIILKEDTLYRLHEIADPVKRPVVSAMYFSFLSHELHFPLPLFFERSEDGQFANIRNFKEDPIQLAGIGMGCALIHRSVLERLEAAWRGADPWIWFGRDVVEADGKPFRLGEDFTFCHRISKMGIPIWGHAGVRVDHVKSRIESMGTFLQGNKLYELEEDERKKVREVQAVEGGQITRNGGPLLEGPDSRQADEQA